MVKLVTIFVSSKNNCNKCTSVVFTITPSLIENTFGILALMRYSLNMHFNQTQQRHVKESDGGQIGANNFPTPGHIQQTYLEVYQYCCLDSDMCEYHLIFLFQYIFIKQIPTNRKYNCNKSRRHSLKLLCFIDNLTAYK